jgi:hypothetical protein
MMSRVSNSEMAVLEELAFILVLFRFVVWITLKLQKRIGRLGK